MVHRIAGHQGDQLILQGDNNSSIDPWNPSIKDVVGKRILLIPKIGNNFSLLTEPALLAALAAGIVTTKMTNHTSRQPPTLHRRPRWLAEPVPLDMANALRWRTEKGPVRRSAQAQARVVVLVERSTVVADRAGVCGEVSHLARRPLMNISMYKSSFGGAYLSTITPRPTCAVGH